MIQAEARDITWVSVLADTDEPYRPADPFDNCKTVVEAVKLEIEYYEQSCGEIDPVTQEHYLQGRDYDPMMDRDYWKTENRNDNR
jgi:hypothetical protein